VVFCKTRCGNIEFLKWFNEFILIKFITDIRSKWNWTDEVNSHPAYVTFDGESIQIDCYTEDKYQNLFKDLNIYLGKLGASCTAVQQPLDRGDIFKAVKAANKSINDIDVIDEDAMDEILMSMISKHEETKDANKRMTSAHKNMLRFGLLRVQKCLLQSKTLSS
jgi:hypothetical protein